MTFLTSLPPAAGVPCRSSAMTSLATWTFFGCTTLTVTTCVPTPPYDTTVAGERCHYQLATFCLNRLAPRCYFVVIHFLDIPYNNTLPRAWFLLLNKRQCLTRTPPTTVNAELAVYYGRACLPYVLVDMNACRCRVLYCLPRYTKHSRPSNACHLLPAT